jgi:hypothetical protein
MQNLTPSVTLPQELKNQILTLLTKSGSSVRLQLLDVRWWFWR